MKSPFFTKNLKAESKANIVNDLKFKILKQFVEIGFYADDTRKNVVTKKINSAKLDIIHRLIKNISNLLHKNWPINIKISI